MTSAPIWRIVRYAAGILGFFGFFLFVFLLIAVMEEFERYKHEQVLARARSQAAERHEQPSVSRLQELPATSSAKPPAPPVSTSNSARLPPLFESMEVEWAITSQLIFVPPVSASLLHEAFLRESGPPANGEPSPDEGSPPLQPSWEEALHEQVSALPAVPTAEIPPASGDLLSGVLQEQLDGIPIVESDLKIEPLEVRHAAADEQQSAPVLAAAPRSEADMEDSGPIDPPVDPAVPPSSEAALPEVDGRDAAPIEITSLSPAPLDPDRHRMDLDCDRLCGEPSTVAAIAPPSESELDPFADMAALERSAQEFAISYLDHWSSNDAAAPQIVASLYGAAVHFHGKPFTPERIIAEKQRFVDRWPEREYKHRPDSIEVRCSAGPGSCTVRSVYDYKVANRATGRTGSGTEELRLLISFASGEPVIVQEDSRPLRAAKPASSRKELSKHERREGNAQEPNDAAESAPVPPRRQSRPSASDSEQKTREATLTSRSASAGRLSRDGQRPKETIESRDRTPHELASRSMPRSNRAEERMSKRASTRVDRTSTRAETIELVPADDLPPGRVPSRYRRIELPARLLPLFDEEEVPF